MNIEELFTLAPHGADTFVGVGPQYPWGGLFGGQIVAQALRAAAATVEPELVPHSLRAYFIRRGDHTEPVRYEVDRIRNGKSFCTRRVVARQAIGAVLNLEASFQRPEPSVEVEAVHMAGELPRPDQLTHSSWSSMFDRATVPADQLSSDTVSGVGRAAMWARINGPIGDDPLIHWCALAYMSDDLPCDAVIGAHPVGLEPKEDRDQALMVASLDHTIWFHRPFRADEWHVYDMTCHSFVASRGLTIGHVFTESGVHVATVAQEVLMRDQRAR
ncbi:MAG: acyl-CoA thioesterase domain-containing protein [Ilumatobacteraceae bacterium]